MTPGTARRRAELVARFSATPARLASVAASADGRPPADGEWSVPEIVRHLIAVDEIVWAPRLRDLRETVDPRWDWVEPRFDAGSPDRPLDVLLGAFAAGRRALVDGVSDLDPAGWARTGTHATFGLLDVTDILERVIEHDDEHLATVGTLAATRSEAAGTPG